MRLAFLLALLAASLAYTAIAFTDLRFLSMTGRLGPGFFPRLIGSALVVACLASLVADFRLSRRDTLERAHLGDLALMVALSIGLVIGLIVLGGTLATMVFLMAALSVLNRGRHLTNLAVSLLLPVAIYGLFHTLLHASVPRGILPFSF